MTAQRFRLLSYHRLPPESFSMETDQPPPPYTLVERPSVTFAEVSTKMNQITTVDGVFRDSLMVFQEFLSIQEGATLLK